LRPSAKDIDVAAANWFCGAAVLRSGKGETGLRLEAEEEMPKFKIQMTNGNELVGCIRLISFIG
jgi:hypothetical protein